MIPFPPLPSSGPTTALSRLWPLPRSPQEPAGSHSAHWTLIFRGGGCGLLSPSQALLGCSSPVEAAPAGGSALGGSSFASGADLEPTPAKCQPGPPSLLSLGSPAPSWQAPHRPGSCPRLFKVKCHNWPYADNGLLSKPDYYPESRHWQLRHLATTLSNCSGLLLGHLKSTLTPDRPHFMWQPEEQR